MTKIRVHSYILYSYRHISTPTDHWRLLAAPARRLTASALAKPFCPPVPFVILTARASNAPVGSLYSLARLP